MDLEFVSEVCHQGWPQKASEIVGVIGDPGKALNVMEFEEDPHRKVRPGHWPYIKSGADDDLTLRVNHGAYRRINSPQPATCATNVEIRVEPLGAVYNSPIFTCFTGGECCSIPMASSPSPAPRKRMTSRR